MSCVLDIEQSPFPIITSINPAVVSTSNLKECVMVLSSSNLGVPPSDAIITVDASAGIPPFILTVTVADV